MNDLTRVETSEQLRQQRITDYQLNGERPEPEFDAVAELAADLFEVPISGVSVLGHDRQIFHGACGLEERHTARSDAFCNLTVERDDVFVVEDALADPRFKANALVVGKPHIRFYAGASIRVGEGVAIGSLCIIDHKPRKLSESDQRRLLMLARTVSNLLEFRLGSHLADERQQEIERQADLLRATLDHIEQGIAVFDRDLRLALWNDRLFELLGLDRSLCREGCGAEDLLRAAASNGTLGPGDPDEIVAALIVSIRTTPMWRLDLQGPGGQIIQASRAAIPDGRSIFSFEDVTQQRRLVKMKDEFVSTVSHELRTPLTSIRGALVILGRKTEGSLDSASQQMLEMALKNAERLTVLINDILDVEKLGSGTLAMRSDVVDLGQMLRDACEHNEPFAQSHGVTLALKVEDEPLYVLGDHSRLLQAVTNLVSNACKFSPDKSTVAISGSREGQFVRIAVQDQGAGIPLDFRPHIFRRFAQSDVRQKSGTVGTGLGLAITKAIVERHQGEIGFTSELGQGTCFWLRLPCSVRMFSERA